MNPLPAVFSLFALPALLALPAAAGVRYDLFAAPEANREKLTKQVEALLPETTGIRYIELPNECKNLPDARNQARAIEAGVTQLPCLVLSDEDGAYAALPLHGLSAEGVEAAQQLAESPDRKILIQKRRFDAHLFFLCARMSLNEMDDRALAETIRNCRHLMQLKQASPERRQFLALRCLYPLLMMQYARGYEGAHTPATEAKLLEAIAALEEARDINPDSPYGRQAHEERERLRAARIKSRQYE